jgi:nucleotide-binding universal stress UspA family protein
MNTSIQEQFKRAGQIVLPPTGATVRKILAPTDFSDESNVGVRHALQLAEKFGAALWLLHVIEPLPVMEGMEGFPLLPTRPELIKEARTKLQSLVERDAKKTLRLHARVITAKPFHGIVTTAAEHGADLIVMSTHGYTGVNHALLGSTTERVVRHAPCPVLTVRVPTAESGTAAPPLKIGRLLVPIDFSELSKNALPLAVSFARTFGAEITLFNVTEIYPIDYLLGRELMNHAITPLMMDAEAALQRMAENLNDKTGMKVSVIVRDGTPHKEICQLADEIHADMIILTTHGYTGLKHVWLGSTAERVVRHARCPVLAVRQGKNAQSTDSRSEERPIHANAEAKSLA